MKQKNNIINNYDMQCQNNQILENIKQINNNNELYNEINKINKMKNIKAQLYNIIDLYNNINSNKVIKIGSIKENKQILINNNILLNKKLNEMTIIYNIDKNKNKMRIFGEYFVKHNKKNCHLLIDYQQNELCQYFKLNNNHKNKDTLKIKLIETNTITNMRGMFSYCNSLKSLPDINNLYTANVTDMSDMFYFCNSLISFQIYLYGIQQM